MRKRSGYQETISDSEYKEGLDDACEDLNSPYKGPKPTPFTQRITRFNYHKRAKLPRNIRVYERNKDLEDHLGIFSAAAEQEEWSMPISCKMFRQTLGGAARNWFDDLDPKSVDNFEELSHKFLEEFSQKKDMLKTPEKFTTSRGGRMRAYKLSWTSSIKEANRGSHGLEEISSSSEGHPPKQPAKWEPRKEWCEGHKHDKAGRKSLVCDDGNHFENQLQAVIGRCSTGKQRGRLTLKEKVFHWLKEGLIRKVQYPEWIPNTIPIKLANGTCKVKIDYSSLNKVYAKDMYPLPEEDEELASLMGYPMMEKVLADQRGQNVETYLEDIVIKSKSEIDLVQDVKETLIKLKRVNIKIDPTMSYFRVKERRKGRNPDTCFLCKPTAARNGNMLHPNRKRVQTLIHIARSLRTVFRKHKVKVVTNGSMEETLKLTGREGRLGKWATEIRTYDISYIQRKEAEGPVLKKFFGQQEQVEETPDANKRGIFDLSRGFQANSTPTTRAWKLYLGRETIEECSSVGIILINFKENMYSYAIRLKFKASNHAMDCEALLVKQVASANQGMKDLHVFIDLLTLVTQVEGNHTPAT
nr:transposon Ty3-I Gag-Pol polyprotein [Tanacetum cinerariifolium]